ncbi:hypothetical protein AMTR_s00110p00119710 [Amborella trichopoda]|uniref:Uncharacterized protein n=1 Tax=Amborella trichopoda TaxID=13333 RepID=W1NSB2_AMBTC|nr:hypothetical protein AMTR_s00110p00119710 [Amborella trichopoda]
MGKPHALMISCPAQGHIRPMMEFSHRMANITFVHTNFNHKHMLEASKEVHPPNPPPPHPDNGTGPIRLISIPDELEPRAELADVSMGWALDVAERLGIERAAVWPAAAGA